MKNGASPPGFVDEDGLRSSVQSRNWLPSEGLGFKLEPKQWGGPGDGFRMQNQVPISRSWGDSAAGSASD